MIHLPDTLNTELHVLVSTSSAGIDISRLSSSSSFLLRASAFSSPSLLVAIIFFLHDIVLHVEKKSIKNICLESVFRRLFSTLYGQNSKVSSDTSQSPPPLAKWQVQLLSSIHNACFCFF